MALLLFLLSAKAEFVLVDGFETQQAGSLHGQHGWIGDGISVGEEPDNPNNQVLTAAGADSEAFVPLRLSPANVSTLFFRLRVEVDNALAIMPVLNWTLGLSSATVSNLPSVVDVDLPLSQNRNADNYYPKRIQTRDGINPIPLSDLYPMIWYGVWIVANPQSNTFQIYLEGGQFALPTRQLDISGKADFSLPTGARMSDLQQFHVRTGFDHAAPIYVDDLYLDLNGQNLTKPPPAPVFPRLEDLQPKPGTRFHPAASGLSFTLSTAPTNQINPTNITVVLNEVNVSSQLVIGGVPSRRTVRLATLESNRFYEGTIIARDNRGRQSVFPLVFDTFVTSQVIQWEGEHYDFQGGQFLNQPDLTAEPGPNSYLDQVGIEGVDLVSIPASREHVFRPGDRQGTRVSLDPPRAEYEAAGLDEIEVGPFEYGEWLSYTHTFPTNYYQIYARVSGTPGLPVSAQLHLVTAPSNTNSPSLRPLGLFETIDLDSTNYFYTALADGLGRPIAVRLEGTQTLRLTSRAVGYRLNYLVFVPSESATPRTPFLSSVFPRPGATGIMPDTEIEVVITDRDTQVDTNRIHMRFDARDVTSSLGIHRSANTTTVKYQPPNYLSLGSNHRIIFSYGDNGTPPFVETNLWQFGVVASLLRIPPSFALPEGSGRSSGFTIRALQAPADPLLPDTLQRTEYQLAGFLTQNGKPVTADTHSLITTPVVDFALPTNLVSQPVENGFFANDFLWTGMTNHNKNLAAETIAYLALQRGTYRFGIRAEDSFRLTAGPVPHDITMTVAYFDGSRSISESQFDFLVETNGVYPFRLSWSQASGKGQLEFYSIDRRTYARTLLNSAGGTRPVMAYRFVTGLTNPVYISEHPTNTIRAVKKQATFQVTTINTAPYWVTPFYQWQSNQIDIAGANHPVYSTPPLAMEDNGNQYRCVVTVPGYRPLFSTEADLTVINDTNPPVIVRVEGSRRFNRVTVGFSEKLNPASANLPANYRFAEGLAVQSAMLDATGTNVILTTSLQQENTPYTLIVDGVQDVWGLAILPNTTARFTSFVLANGFLTREIYEDIRGTAVYNLTNSPRFLNEEFDRMAGIMQFETPLNDGVFYGQKVSGYVTAPENGNTVFYIAANNGAELWLSIDGQETNKALIARVDIGTRPQEWTNSFFQASGAISLLAGQVYYMEALHMAGYTNDHLEVSWVLPSQAGRPNPPVIIPGDFLSTYVNPDLADVVITLQPTNVTVPESRTAKFAVAATGSSALGTNLLLYQWYGNGQPIPGATAADYTTPPVKKSDDQSRFQCLISVPGKSLFSDEAVLTVTEAVDLPPLFIERRGQEAVVGWISTATNLVLEANTNLLLSPWFVAPEPIARHAETNFIVAPMVEDRFFRLRSP